jgi:uncharacterized protein YqeY
MIGDTITKQISEALKARDSVRLSTLRMLSSALSYARIDKQADLTEEDEIDVVKREARKRKDAIEAYEKAEAKDKADREKEELEILKEFLPEQMEDSELQNLIDEAIKTTNASSVKEMGKVIGVVMSKAGGKADGKRVAEMVKKKLG